MRMLDFLHKAAAIKVFEFANSYGIRWQSFVQALQAVVQFRKALLVRPSQIETVYQMHS